jgi:hypothetical protein
MWTLVDEENDIIHVRAVIHKQAQQSEIRDLITALEKRLPKEPPDERHADVRRPDPRPAGDDAASEKAETQANPQTQGA